MESDTLFLPQLIFQMIEMGTPAVQLHRGDGETTDLSSIVLTTLPCDAVRSHYPQSHLIYRLKEVGNVPYWEASRLGFQSRGYPAGAGG